MLRKVFITVSLAALLVGAFFRFHGLQQKLFWQDEAYTALRVTGHSNSDYVKLFDGRVHSVNQVLSFQQLDKGTSDAHSLVLLQKEEPHQGPLYYFIERYFVDAIGSSIAAFRFLSAVLGVLGIGLAYLFGRKLFSSATGGLLLASLIATSPFFILYSTQARAYALLIDATLFASWAFLIARSTNSVRTWALYALALVLGLYTDPIFILTIVAHFVVMLILDRKKPTVVRRFLSACVASFVLLTPWIINAVFAWRNVSGQLDWGRTVFPATYFVDKWVFNITALFFDYEFHNQRFIVLVPFFILVVLFACIFTVRWSSAVVRAFALTLPAVTFGCFVLLDLLQGAHYSTIMRYVSAGWIGIMCAVAATLLAGISSQRHILRVGTLVCYVAILVCGAGSAIARDGIVNWWDNNDHIAYQDVAAVLNEKQRPLIITEAHWHMPLVLAHYLRSDASFLLLRENEPFPLPHDLDKYENAFLVGPSSVMLAHAEANGVHLVNVSPASTNLITRAHTQYLSRSQGSEEWEVPNNALWTFHFE